MNPNAGFQPNNPINSKRALRLGISKRKTSSPLVISRYRTNNRPPAPSEKGDPDRDALIRVLSAVGTTTIPRTLPRTLIVPQEARSKGAPSRGGLGWSSRLFTQRNNCRCNPSWLVSLFRSVRNWSSPRS